MTHRPVWGKGEAHQQQHPLISKHMQPFLKRSKCFTSRSYVVTALGGFCEHAILSNALHVAADTAGVNE